MNYLGPTSRPRLNEAVAVVFLFAGLFLLISLVSYDPFDPSWNTATSAVKPLNLMGRAGATLADFLLQAFGFAAYAIPVLTLLLGWSWVRSAPIHTPWAKLAGSALLVGIVVSGVTGCLVIRFFMHYLRRGTLTFFVAYRVIFGIIIIALAHFFRFTG